MAYRSSSYNIQQPLPERDDSSQESSNSLTVSTKGGENLYLLPDKNLSRSPISAVNLEDHIGFGEFNIDHSSYGQYAGYQGHNPFAEEYTFNNFSNQNQNSWKVNNNNNHNYNYNSSYPNCSYNNIPKKTQNPVKNLHDYHNKGSNNKQVSNQQPYCRKFVAHSTKIQDPYNNYVYNEEYYASTTNLAPPNHQISQTHLVAQPYQPQISNQIPPFAAPIQAPSASSNSKKSLAPVDGYIYQVQFKRAHKNYILSPSAPRDILPGDFVKVEADRGEDMGIVLSKIHVDNFEEVIPTAGYRGRGFSSGHGERKYLFRLATPEERASLVKKVQDEEKALETIREKLAERNLKMSILDAEYQYDRHKLTFYFEADNRIDFRDLVSELFSQYKTRIWMQQVDPSSISAHDPGTELAKATGFLPDREGESVSIRSSISFTTDDTANSNFNREFDQANSFSDDSFGKYSGHSFSDNSNPIANAISQFNFSNLAQF